MWYNVKKTLEGVKNMLIIILLIVSVVVIYYAVQELKRQREEERKRAKQERERQERIRQQQEKSRQEKERRERIRQQQEKEKQLKKNELGRKYPNMTENAKEFIIEYKINHNDILDCTSENRVGNYDTTICKFPIKLKDSKVEKNHVLNATIHFLYNPNTRQNSIALFCKCIYHFDIYARGRTPVQLLQFKQLADETEQRCGHNSAFIDPDCNLCSCYEANNVNISQVKDTVLELENKMQKLASLLYDFCLNNF